MNTPVITLDGPSGSGKGTISLALARGLGWHLLDSGAIYRLVGLAALRKGLPAEESESLTELALGLECSFRTAEDGVEAILDNHPVGAQIRTQEVADMASRVAAIPAVRAALLQRQKDFRMLPGLVADGRDMGTCVFPDAEYKFFLTASAEERARRRAEQLRGKGEDVKIGGLLLEINARDARDIQRAASPLKPAEDAFVIDTSQLPIAAVLEKVRKILSEKGLSMAG